MRIRLLCIAFALSLAAHTASGLETPQLTELKPAQQQSQAARLAAALLTRFHYKAMPLDDAMSEKIFDHYLKSLDSEKFFFLQADIDQWSGARTQLDDAILNEDLSVPFAMFNLYAQRASERFAYARGLLKEGFNFQQKESFQFTREKEAWAKSEAEIRELWRKRVKNDWLRLKLAGKDDKNIAETLDKRYENSQKRLGRAKAEDAFQVFMNAYTTAIEPHTSYLGVRAAEDFDISMRLSLEGIGAVLTEKDEYTLIRELVPGGPAALSGQLKTGDRILGVAQGESGPMTDVLGWRLDDTVALIRGAANSVVRLSILPAEAGPDGKQQVVPIIRKKISLEEQSAKKSVLSVTDNGVTRQIGVISLPTFYMDFEARQKGAQDFKSASRDVARLLGELKKEKVDSVLIDLRNNGGGSLSEAIELTGLFIDRGPVVQQRNAQGKLTVENDTRAGVAWDGNLGVLINRGSASASEIFAAAIQDYGRGLIIGEKSFGKGTVQTMINLDQLAKNDKPKYGEVKLTVAQFFRINGGTTQLRGVTPDILFPTVPDLDNTGEAGFDNALPWVQIKAAEYSPVGDMKYLRPVLMSRHEDRLKKDKDFQYLLEDIADLKGQIKKNQVSLNEAERRKERDVREAKLEARKDVVERASEAVAGQQSATEKNRMRRDDGLQADERDVANDLALKKARENAKDVLLNEAVHILSDGAGVATTGPRLTARNKPAAVSTTN